MAKRYMKLVSLSHNTEEALRGLQAVKPPVEHFATPDEAEADGVVVTNAQHEAAMEWLDMFNYYTNRLDQIMEEMEGLEAHLPPSDECHVHQLVGHGAGLCSTASRYSVPIGGNGCQFCLRDQVMLAKRNEEE